MAIEAFSVMHTKTVTVFFRLLDLANSKIFDFDDNQWEVDLATATTPNLAAAENTDLGDDDLSLYRATLEASNLNSTNVPMRILIQALQDLTPDVIIQTREILIVSGRILSITDIRNAVTGGDYPISTDPNGRVRLVDGTLPGEINLTNGTVAIAPAGIGTSAFVNGAIKAATFEAGAVNAAALAADAANEIAAAVRTEIASELAKIATLHDARLTAARAGFLDNLNVGGLVASQAEILAVSNNTRVRVVIPAEMKIPDTGSTLFRLDLYIYDELGGMEAPDSLPTIVARNHLGTDRSANLGTVTLSSTGHYFVTYEVASTHLIEPVTFEWTIIEGGDTRLHGGIARVSDLTAAMGFNSSDRGLLVGIDADVDVAVSTRSSQSAADVWAAVTRTLSDKTGFALSAAARLDIWNELTAGLTLGGSVGKLIVDNLDAPVSGVGGGGGDTIIIGPVQTSNAPSLRTTTPVPLSMFQHEAHVFDLIVRDALGAFVDLSSITLRFIVFTTKDPTVPIFDVEDSLITVIGSNNEIARVPITPDDADTARRDLRWLLWNVTTPASPVALLNGSLIIKPSVLDAM